LPDSDRGPLRERLAAIVREAGELALVASKTPLKRWTKAGASPVSEADIAVNDLLAVRLPALAPEAGWLSEETEDDLVRTDAAEVWIVDPIDGTRAYLDHRADWSISIALVKDGRPVLAAIYAPVTDELFLAARGQGATVNGARLKVSAGEGLNGARLAGPQRYLKRLVALNPRILPQPKVHSLALRLARVAGGEFDAAFAARNGYDWDLAAADLLVQEAGGALTDFNGQPLGYNRPEPVHGALVAAGPARHGTLIDLLRDRRAEFA
jgi:myo-inositol-1(or 4)-monophosphatase